MNKTVVDSYIDDNIKKGLQYVEDVKSGKITTNKYIKLAVQRYEKDLLNPDYIHKWDEVKRFFRFCYLVNVKHHNTYKRFQPLPFQSFIIINLILFWFSNEPDKRRFRYFFLFVARKNGKSVFASIFALYFLVGDKELDPTSLVVASTREQANILLDYGKNIVLNSPKLQSKLAIMQYAIKYQSGTSRGIFKVLPNNANRLDGYNQNCAILDEIHSYTDDSLFRVIKSGILARKNPMTILISTAGFNIDSFCNDLVEISKSILKGDIEDESFFAMIYTLDEEDDYRDPKNWIKSVPALDEIISLNDMMIEFKQAQNMSSLLNNFLTKNLNLFTSSTNEWIEDSYIKEAFNKKPISINDFIGQQCWVGIDLSSTQDLTSIVYLFYDPDTEEFSAVPYFFMANNPKKKFRKGGINLEDWIRKGHIIECSTKTIDYDLLFNHIMEMSTKVDIQSIQYDQYNSALLVNRLENEGLFCENFAQTALTFNFPLKLIEKVIYEKKINLSNNPVMRWNFRNVVIYQDGNGNIKIIKNKAKDAVDGVVSLGMAMGGWLKAFTDGTAAGLAAYTNQFS